MAAAAVDDLAVLDTIEMNEERYIELLGKLIGESERVQNAPPDYNPHEDCVSDHVLAALEPHTMENGGPLVVERVSFVKGRGNVIVKYPGTSATDTIGFIGCHLDVVPANPDTWDFPPFELTRDGDKLRGRGTTDCLGHVAAMTELYLQLAEKRPALRSTIVTVFIASEEDSSEEGVGVEGLLEAGALDILRGGPVFWMDSADSQPRIGTGGVIRWTLAVEGKQCHSSLPQHGVNAIELAMEAMSTIQRRFYEDFPSHPQEKVYGFATPCTMKPTQWDCASNRLNEICPRVTVSGDIRVTPFYTNDAVKAAVEGYVEDLNAHVATIPTRGPCSKYVLDTECVTDDSDTSDEAKTVDRGRMSLTWGLHELEAVACDLKSPAFHALDDAIREVRGSSTPFSLTGAMPVVAELQRRGFDLQITGFGLSSTYHANNEYCLLFDMKRCLRVCARIISKVEAKRPRTDSSGEAKHE